MISHHPAIFGYHRHSGSGDTMLLVVRERDSTCFCLSPSMLESTWYIMLTLSMMGEKGQKGPLSVFPL